MPRPALFALLLCLALAVPTLGAAPLWTHNATEPVRAVALSSDGNIVAVASDHLHIFNRTGSLLAITFPPNDVAVAASGELVVSGTGDAVHAYTGDGTELWSAPNATAALAVSGDGGTIAVLGVRGDLAFYDAEGSLTGTADTDEKGEGVRVAISRSGSVVAAAYERGLRVFSDGGGERWAAELPSPYAIAVNASGDLVAVGDGGSVKFFNRTGERLGRFLTGAPVRSVAMASAGNTTVAGAEDGSLLAFGPDGTLRWKRAVGRPGTGRDPGRDLGERGRGRGHGRGREPPGLRPGRHPALGGPARGRAARARALGRRDDRGGRHRRGERVPVRDGRDAHPHADEDAKGERVRGQKCQRERHCRGAERYCRGRTERRDEPREA